MGSARRRAAGYYRRGFYCRGQSYTRRHLGGCRLLRSSPHLGLPLGAFCATGSHLGSMARVPCSAPRCRIVGRWHFCAPSLVSGPQRRASVAAILRWWRPPRLPFFLSGGRKRRHRRRALFCPICGRRRWTRAARDECTLLSSLPRRRRRPFDWHATARRLWHREKEGSVGDARRPLCRRLFPAVPTVDRIRGNGKRSSWRVLLFLLLLLASILVYLKRRPLSVRSFSRWLL